MPSYIPAWRYGGPIHSVHGLCKALAARGHEVAVATTNVDGEGESDVVLEEPVALDGVRVHYFASRRLRRLYFSPRMRRFMEREIPRCDIVHTHSVFLWPTSAAAATARRSGKPYVLSPRGMLVRDLIERRNPLLKKAWIAAFERKNVARAAAVHVTSQIEAREMLSLGLAPRRIVEIPNGVDLEGFRDAGARGDSGEPYVLFLGRISWKKGLDRLIGAMSRAGNVPLVIAGPDDETLWPSLERQARELGLADRVRYVGPVEGRQKQRLVADAALLALPSRSENFGNVVLEAMAAGVPPVVTPEVGLADYVRRTDCGLVAEGTEQAFGEAMRHLLDDAALRGRLGANGRTAAAEYSWPTVAARMEAEYRRLSA